MAWYTTAVSALCVAGLIAAWVLFVWGLQVQYRLRALLMLGVTALVAWQLVRALGTGNAGGRALTDRVLSLTIAGSFTVAAVLFATAFHPAARKERRADTEHDARTPPTS